MNRNNDQLWQQASTLASEQVTKIMRTKGLTGDEQHRLHTELRDAEYARLMDVKRAETRERMRKRTPEELEAAQKAQDAADELQRRIVIAQQEAKRELETIRMNSARQIKEIDDQMETVTPLVLAGLAYPDEELELIHKRQLLESRSRVAIALADRAKQQAVDESIAEAVRRG